MTITLASSIPAQGATDVLLNKSIELTFNKAISSSSLTNNVFSLINIDNGTTVPLTVSAGFAGATKVILLPSVALLESTQYRIIIVGSSEELGFSLVAQDSDTLTTTITIEFSTGTSVYKVDTTLEKEAGSLTNEGDLFLPTNVKALGYEFTVDKVRPKNNSHGVEPTLTGNNTIRFTFSKDLYTGSSDYTSWADISLFPLLNETNYLVSGTSFGTATIPAYTVSVTGQDLLISFATELPKNLGVQISLQNDIRSSDGDYYGGKLLYSINTKLYPEIYGIETIKREVREVSETFTHDYIGALLFKNTIWLWERVGRSFSITAPSFAAKQHIIYSTILDLMEDKEYYKYVVAGTRRQLGDLGVSVDSLIGRLAMKVAKYQKLKDDAFQSVIAGWQFRIGQTTAGYSDTAATVNRLWYNVSSLYTETRFSYHQENIPASNVLINRTARSNNPIWW